MRAIVLTAISIGAALAAIAPAQAMLVISKAPSSNVTCVGGTCSATAADAVLNVKDLRKLLGASDVTVASGSSAVDIEIDAQLNWVKPTRLTLDSYRAITFTLPVTVQGTGAVTLKTNDGGTGGDYSFVGKGKLAFWDTSSSLIINGTSFVLVNDITTLATDIAANPSGFYALARGYDASMDGTYTQDPIPTVFSGTLEGLGHAFMNVAMANPTTPEKGFFAEIDAGGVVRDLNLVDTEIVINHSMQIGLGVLAGKNSGLIHGANVAATVRAHGTYLGIGGLVGYNLGTIEYCTTSGNIAIKSKHSSVGGLVVTNAGIVTNSHSSSSVLAQVVGGLVAFNEGSITLSFAEGHVQADGNYFPSDDYGGGLVGWNQGSIDRSFATGIVSVYCALCQEHSSQAPLNASAEQRDPPRFSILEIGGLVGLASNEEVSITNSYATGAVNAYGAYGGGLVGASTGQISSSYAVGAITGKLQRKLGGFSSRLVTATASDYWDTDTAGTRRSCGHDSCPNVTGLTDAQLKSGLPAGFDPAVWAQSASINNGYPYLIANPPQ